VNTNNVTFRRLDADEPRPEFDCGDADLNEFFFKDSSEGYRQLVSVTYAVEIDGELVGFFCVSNDAIRSDDTSKSRLRKIRNRIPREKRYSSMPAVKIGRLVTDLKFQGKGIGTQILDLIKMWFTIRNKTGCRFVIVDAVNNSATLKFYQKNGFEFLDEHSASNTDHTRLMFFDLITFKK
jgi:GNAT superfamily N-acetyltransferase